MKKILLTAAIVAVTLSSCSKNEAVESTALNAISFDNSFIGNTTKASVTTATDLNKEGGAFDVYAYYTAAVKWGDSPATVSLFMSDEAVTYDATNGWGYTNTKYWPANQQYISFFGYTPNNYKITGWTGASKTSSTPSFTYTVPAKYTSHADFLVAQALDKTGNTNGTSSKVIMPFTHALSKIGFSAQLNDNYSSDATFTVTNITVKYHTFRNTGIYTYSGTSDAGSWASPSTASYYTEGEEALNINKSLEIKYPTSDVTATSLTESDEYLMLIPQADTKLTVVLSYEVTYADLNNTTIKNVQSVTTSKTTYKQAKQYTMNLVVSQDAIEFGDVTVGEWSDGTMQNQVVIN